MNAQGEAPRLIKFQRTNWTSAKEVLACVGILAVMAAGYVLRFLFGNKSAHKP